jgi:glycosyl transferase family 25
MHAYIINMDSATDRWRFVSEHFAATGIPFSRISGVNGRELTLPIREYDESAYRRCHGQRTNLGAVGCFLSHLQALRTFLDSEHATAIIAEDDAKPVADLREILVKAIAHQDSWDILRLCGFHNPHPAPYARLDDQYQLCVCFTRLCGTGAYAVTRRAAEALLAKLTPMYLPIDHALDREWAYGLRAAAVVPLPISQEEHGFGSQIHANLKLPWLQRYLTVFPWRAWNESTRLVQRTRQLRAARRMARAA